MDLPLRDPAHHRRIRLASTSQFLWILFLASSLAITIVLVAFVAAMVLGQRERTKLRQQQAQLVARAHEEERAWVASELHDDVLQRIALVRAEVESLWVGDRHLTPATQEDHLRGINAELVDLAVAVRRIAARLHPTLVDQVGLVTALDSLVDEIERGSELAVEVVTEGSADGLAPDAARAAYRIVQESLRNVVRHSSGRNARVSLAFANGTLTLKIQDDGRGFDTTVTARDGLGLASLRERALIVGGKAEVISRPGHGTTVLVRIPLNPV